MKGSVNVPGLTLPDARRLLTAKELIYDPAISKLDAKTIQAALDLLAEIKAAALHAAQHAADGADPITPAAIGAAAASHGTHVSFSTAVPVAPGTAAVGTATTVARSDHRHPLQTTVSGNAGTATKLATARTIRTNLASAAAVSFDGSANVAPGVTGILPVANGGTGVSTLAALAEALQSGGGMCKIQTGSYVGTGTYGSANPCSITFDFIPKLVVIQGGRYPGIIIPASILTASFLTSYGWDTFDGATTSTSRSANLVDKTVSWYCGSTKDGEYCQANGNGETYTYIAIG